MIKSGSETTEGMAAKSSIRYRDLPALCFLLRIAVVLQNVADSVGVDIVGVTGNVKAFASLIALATSADTRPMVSASPPHEQPTWQIPVGRTLRRKAWPVHKSQIFDGGTDCVVTVV